MAEGAAVTGGPSYFQQHLIPGPEAMKELRLSKEITVGLIGRAEQWASLAVISLSPTVTRADLPALKKIHDEAVHWWRSLKESILAARGSSRLAEAMVNEWFAALVQALARTEWEASEITKDGKTNKSALGPILQQLNSALAALTSQSAWRVVP